MKICTYVRSSKCSRIKKSIIPDVLSPSYQLRHLPKLAAEEEQRGISNYSHTILIIWYLCVWQWVGSFSVPLVRIARLSSNPEESQKGSSSACRWFTYMPVYKYIIPPTVSVCGVLWTNKIDDLLFFSFRDSLFIVATVLSMCARASRSCSAYFWMSARFRRDCCRQEEAMEKNSGRMMEHTVFRWWFLVVTGRTSDIPGMFM